MVNKIFINKKKLILLSFLFLLFFFHVYLIVLPIKNYQWLGLISDDQLYLIEQFLEKINFSKERLNFSHAEYGSEFFYYAFFAKFLIPFFDKDTNINFFYIISSFHLFLSLASIFYIFKILNLFRIKGYLLFCLLLLIFTDRNFLINISILKPDINIIFFFITISFYNILIFYKSSKINNLVLSIFFSAVSASIKFYGFFMILPIIYSLYIKEINFYKIIGNKLLYFFFSLSIILIFYFISNLIQFIALNQYLDNSVILTLNKNLNLFFFLLYYFILSLFFISFLKIFFKQKETHLIYKNSFSIIILFFCFFLIISTPFFLDAKSIVHSFYWFYYKVPFDNFVYNPNFFSRILIFFEKIYANNFIYLFCFLSFFLITKMILLKKINVVFFLFCIQLILFYFFYGRTNIGFVLVYIFFFVGLISIINNFSFLNCKKNNFLFYIILIFFLLLINGKNINNIYKFYSLNFLIPSQINLIQKNLDQNLNNVMSQYSKKNKTVEIIFLCRGTIPFENKKFKRLTDKICLSQNDIIFKIQKNEILIITESDIKERYESSIGYLLRNKKFKLIKKMKFKITAGNKIREDSILFVTRL